MNTFLFWATTLWMVVLLVLGVLAVRHVVREAGRPDDEPEPGTSKGPPDDRSSTGASTNSPS